MLIEYTDEEVYMEEVEQLDIGDAFLYDDTIAIRLDKVKDFPGLIKILVYRQPMAVIEPVSINMKVRKVNSKLTVEI